LRKTQFDSDQVKHVYDVIPESARIQMLALRELIYVVAKSSNAIGALEETLKWGEPAYLTSETKSGSLVRLGWKQKDPDCVRVLFHCQTNLVETFRTMFADELMFEGNRAIVLKVGKAIPTASLRFCIEAALTYRLSKVLK
jgi:Domain of unknown function (DU1801)